MHSAVTVQLNGGEYPNAQWDRSTPFAIDTHRPVDDKYASKDSSPSSFSFPSLSDLSVAKLLGRRDAPQSASGSSADQSTVTFVLLCGLWYMSSALSSNTGKAILTQFRYPVTLTFVQFGFVAAYCLLFMSPAVRFARLRTPTRAIIRSTLPMGAFQVGGHMFSSIAISRIPVSTVHTIKVRPQSLSHPSVGLTRRRHYRRYSPSLHTPCSSASAILRRRIYPSSPLPLASC